MGELSIRDAAPEDIPALARLRWDFRSEHGDVAPGTSFEGFAVRFGAFASDALGEERWRVVVAERKSRLVGAMWLQLVPKIPAPSARGELIGYVTFAYVVPEERGGGVGALLLARLVDVVRGLPVEFLMTWPTERSESFYERAGFRRSEGVWERYLIHYPYGTWAAEPGPTEE